jgi:hypothetical protein
MTAMASINKQALGVLRARGKISVGALAEALAITSAQAENCCQRLLKIKYVHRIKRGWYGYGAEPKPEPVVEVAPAPKPEPPKPARVVVDAAKVPSQRIANSFTVDEVLLLDEIRRGLVYRHRDLSHLARHSAFGNLSRKLQSMAASLKSAPSSRDASSSPALSNGHTHSPSGADLTTHAGG